MSAKSECTEQHPEARSAQYVRGIGPKRYEALVRLGIKTIRDLCYFFPRRYEDRANFQTISSLQANQDVTIRGEIVSADVKQLKKITLFELVIHDGTDSIPAVWFNQPYLKNQFQIGEHVILSGKTEYFQNRLQLTSPEYEVTKENEDEPTHVGRIIPIYALTEGLIQRPLRQAMKQTVDRHISEEIQEFLPASIRKRLGLMDLTQALQEMHFPTSWQQLERARERIIFDEFFTFELLLISRIRTLQSQVKAIPFQFHEELLHGFRNALPFELTEDQVKAMTEIAHDVSREIPMNRLLQGEVGTGKTMVATFVLYLCAKSKSQSVLIAPTEILAEQHFQRLQPLMSSLGIATALLTGSVEARERQPVYELAQSGNPCVFIGTHALLQEEIRFKNLGLLVIDEQHRFGVEQRAKLVQRNPRPHLLVMTATPIPRTLGLTLYGDFDITTMHEQPRGRKTIKTFWIRQEKTEEVLEHIRDTISKTNEQAYILFPIIEETERTDLQAATQEFERLKRGTFKEIPMGLVHGRLSRKEREAVMARFHAGTTRVLVSTSVIEVGVDNPHVTFMVIENAERFGLSQLHQMRGRIGRGTKESMCFLFGSPSTEDGKRRLRILTKTHDGFVIAEEDLALRGPGDFFGTKQSGLTFFKIGNLIRDKELLFTARKEAVELLNGDLNFSNPEHVLLAEELRARQRQIESS